MTTIALRRHFAALCVFLVGSTAVPEAAAEGFLDVYAGGAFTESSDAEFKTGSLGSIHVPVDWEDSSAFGLRAGGFFGGAQNYVGLGVDISYFRPSGFDDTIEINMIPITLMVLARVPLATSDAIPGGRIQPYAAFGPSLVVTVLTSRAASGSAPGFDLGIDARAGLKVMLTSAIGLFCEWRYTDVKASMEDAIGDRLKVHLQTNHVNGGIAFHF